MAPIVHGLEDKYGEVIEFVYFDIDDPQTQSFRDTFDYDIRWRPYILFLSGDGEVVGSPYIGYVNGETLEVAVVDFLTAEGVIQAR